MKFKDLIRFKNGQLVIEEKSFYTKRPNHVSVHEATMPASIVEPRKAEAILGEKFLTVNKSESGNAIWVPYLAQISVYGYLNAGQAVAVSGPFSGCYFEIGQHEGRIYVAHVSCENKTDTNVVEWLEGGGLPGRHVLFRKKIGLSEVLPDGARNAAAIVFADVKGVNCTVTRVDALTQSAGGMSGPIFDVRNLPSDTI